MEIAEVSMTRDIEICLVGRCLVVLPMLRKYSVATYTGASFFYGHVVKHVKFAKDH